MLDLKTAIKIAIKNKSRWISEPISDSLYYITKDDTGSIIIVDYLNRKLDFETMNQLGKRYIPLVDVKSILTLIPKTGLWCLINLTNLNRDIIVLVKDVVDKGLITSNNKLIKFDSIGKITPLPPSEVQTLINSVDDFTRNF